MLGALWHKDNKKVNEKTYHANTGGFHAGV